MNKFIRGFGYALKGLWYACKTQLNFRVHMVCTLMAVFMGWALKISPGEWLWIVICVGLVLLTELLNTALELLCDVISPEYNEKIGHVKDISAGAVLITAVTALIIGAVIFLPKLLALLHHAA